MRSKFLDAFKSSSPEQRRLFLAEMALNNPELGGLHAVLKDLHEKLNEIHGDDSDE